MIERPTPEPRFVFALAAVAAFASLDTVAKYLGWTGTIGFTLFAFIAVLVVVYWLIPAFADLVSERAADILAGLFFVAVTIAALVGYRYANSGQFGPGSDADDALMLAAGELVSGRYPYYAKTYLGNALSPMPGAVILAIPFVVTNLIALQNVFWLGGLYLAMRRAIGDARYAVVFAAVVVGLSPSVWQGLATGGDYISNSIYVLLAMWWMYSAVSRPEGAKWERVVSAVCVGMALSSRSNFAFVFPLLFSVLVRNAGWGKAIKYSLIAVAAAVLLTLSFWMYDPSAFTPFIVPRAKVAELDTILPYASIFIPLGTLLLSFGLALRGSSGRLVIFLRNAAIVQAFILIVTAVLYGFWAGSPSLYVGTTGYG
ncbi:MAG: hypothetical protein H0V76_11080, partial [Blastocatellia bacterium]|nr:hypothetical protein [Blastocatellia bacterium]